MEVTPVEAFDDTDGAARAQLNDTDGAARARLKAELKAEILAELYAQELRGPELLDVARSIKPTIMGEMGSSSVMRKRLSTMARVDHLDKSIPEDVASVFPRPFFAPPGEARAPLAVGSFPPPRNFTADPRASAGSPSRASAARPSPRRTSCTTWAPSP
jgi:hypothetical protein